MEKGIGIGVGIVVGFIMIGFIGYFVYLAAVGANTLSGRSDSYMPRPPVGASAAARTDDGWRNHSLGMRPQGAYPCTKPVGGVMKTGYCSPPRSFPSHPKP